MEWLLVKYLKSKQLYVVKVLNSNLLSVYVCDDLKNRGMVWVGLHYTGVL